MKLSILLVALFTITESRYIKSYRDEVLYLTGIELKPDEPLNINSSYSVLIIKEATGSIGIKTFSKIPQLLVLTMENSTINHVEDDALCSFPNLQHLNLYSMKKFPVLTHSLLRNCDKIKSFVAGVEMERDVFKGMSSLEKLYIMNQNITRFTRDYLEPLKNLRFLELSGCRIDQIDDGSICLSSKLDFLIVNAINVPHILPKAIFENCNTITDFMFIYNHYIQIKEGVFSGFTNVKRVRIDHININTLTSRYLSGLSNAEELRIENSNFTRITNSTFSGFNHLENLILSGNQVNEIEARAISSIPNLEYLDLSANKLRTIDNINNVKLTTLILNRNMISKINSEDLKYSLPNLDYLEISENGMKLEDEVELKRDLEGITVYGTKEIKSAYP